MRCMPKPKKRLPAYDISQKTPTVYPTIDHPKGVITIDIDYLIDQLESLRDRGIRIPLTKMVLIDEEQFDRLINQLRISVPKEIQEARHVQQERDRLIAQAQEQARNLVLLAEQQAEELLSEHGLAQRVAAREQAILEKAHQEAERIRAEADEYAMRVLKELQEQLQRFESTVRNGIQLLESGKQRPSADQVQEQASPEPVETPAEEPVSQ